MHWVQLLQWAVVISHCIDLSRRNRDNVTCSCCFCQLSRTAVHTGTLPLTCRPPVSISSLHLAVAGSQRNKVSVLQRCLCPAAYTRRYLPRGLYGTFDNGTTIVTGYRYGSSYPAERVVPGSPTCPQRCMRPVATPPPTTAEPARTAGMECNLMHSRRTLHLTSITSSVFGLRQHPVMKSQQEAFCWQPSRRPQPGKPKRQIRRRAR